MAAAPARPWRAPENSADVKESFLQAKPAKRENSAEVPSMQSCLPQLLRFSKNQTAIQSARANINEAFKGDGCNIEGSRTDSGIKEVARRLSV